MENRNILSKARTYSFTHTAYFVFLIIFSLTTRLLPHPPNMTSITGLSLLAGSTIKNKFFFIIPVFVLFLSDIFLGFHKTIPFVYGSYIAISFIGKFIKPFDNVKRLILFSISSSILFFLITNFGVWITSPMYTKNIQGLLNSYIMGIPFFRNTVFGDIIFTFVYFYGYRYISLFQPLLWLKKSK